MCSKSATVSIIYIAVVILSVQNQFMVCIVIMLLIACDFFEMLQYVSFAWMIFEKMHTDSVLKYYMHVTHIQIWHVLYARLI